MSLEPQAAPATPDVAPQNKVFDEPAQPQAVDSAPAKEEAKQDEDPRFASRFAALSRKEKAILERERRLKEIEAEFSTLKKSKENAKIDPIAFLQEHGLSFEQLTDHILSGGKPKELTLEEREARLKEQILGEVKSQAEQERRQKAEEDGKAAIDAYKRQIQELVDSKPDDYELIKASDAADQVWEKIESHYNETGKLLSVQEASDEVEKLLLEGYRNILGKTKKISLAEALQQKEDGSQQEVFDSGRSVVAPKTEAPPTLTNKAAAQPMAGNTQNLSEDELRRRAIAMLKWKA